MVSMNGKKNIRIELESPFSLVYKLGYLQLHPSGRKYVYLVSKTDKRTLMSYARYLMSVKLNAFLDWRLHVDHINDDKTDDRIENLQILTHAENVKKEAERYRREEMVFVDLKCDECEKEFQVPNRVYQARKKQNTGNRFFCSKECSRKNIYPVTPSLTQEQINNIRSLRKEGLSSYKIRDKTGVSRNTIMKYWK